MQAQENPLLPWQDSLASQRWQMEQALLQLYLEPDRAAQQLAQLADDALRDDIHARLGAFAAADHRLDARSDDSAYVYCTWRFADLPAATRHRLRQLGFAAGSVRARTDTAETLAAPGAGRDHADDAGAHRMQCCAVPLVHTQPAASTRHRRQFMTIRSLAAQTIRLQEPLVSGNYRVTLGSARQIESLPTVPAGADIPVTWRWQEESNAVRLEGQRQCDPARWQAGAADPGL